MLAARCRKTLPPARAWQTPSRLALCAPKAATEMPTSEGDPRTKALEERFCTFVSTDPQPQIILGTQSQSRRAVIDRLAKQFDFKYSSITADIDEQAIRRDDPQELVLVLAHAKADAIVKKLQASSSLLKPGFLVTCDQVVVHNGRIREKPASEEEARAFIASYADGPATTVGACVCVCLDTGISYEHVEVNKAHIDKLPDATIDQLIQEGNVFKCAGGLMIEHPLVQQHVKSIEGSIDGIMGLSTLAFMRVLLKTVEDSNETPSQ